MVERTSELKRAPIDSSVHMDAIRGLAGLLVFLGHGRSLFLRSGLHHAIAGDAVTSPAANAPPVKASALAGPASVGHLAVIVFFVLSGYFVGGSVIRSMRRGSFSWRAYGFQRLTRLWVVLIPALLLGLALDTAGLHLPHAQQNIYSGTAGTDVLPHLASRESPVVFFGNLFFLQGIYTPPFGTNLALWSLTFEFWFYVFFPLLMTVFVAWARPPARVVSALLLLAFAALCGQAIVTYFLLWLLGAGVALLPLRIPSTSRKAITLALGILLLLTLYLELRFPLNLFVSDLILSVVFCAFLWAILHARERNASTLYRRGAQTLSATSYTLYLIHVPMLVFICGVIMPVWQPWALSFRSATLFAGICALVFAAAWGMYLLFERNTDAIRTWLWPQATKRKLARLNQHQS
jgi:peptidoglycan/LPS O-acetylase OafA/YrhL